MIELTKEDGSVLQIDTSDIQYFRQKEGNYYIKLRGLPLCQIKEDGDELNSLMHKALAGTIRRSARIGEVDE